MNGDIDHQCCEQANNFVTAIRVAHRIINHPTHCPFCNEFHGDLNMILNHSTAIHLIAGNRRCDMCRLDVLAHQALIGDRDQWQQLLDHAVACTENVRQLL